MSGPTEKRRRTVARLRHDVPTALDRGNHDFRSARVLPTRNFNRQPIASQGDPRLAEMPIQPRKILRSCPCGDDPPAIGETKQTDVTPVEGIDGIVRAVQDEHWNRPVGFHAVTVFIGRQVCGDSRDGGNALWHFKREPIREVAAIGVAHGEHPLCVHAPGGSEMLHQRGDKRFIIDVAAAGRIRGGLPAIVPMLPIAGGIDDHETVLVGKPLKFVAGGHLHLLRRLG